MLFIALPPFIAAPPVPAATVLLSLRALTLSVQSLQAQTLLIIWLACGAPRLRACHGFCISVLLPAHNPAPKQKATPGPCVCYTGRQGPYRAISSFHLGARSQAARPHRCKALRRSHRTLRAVLPFPSHTSAIEDSLVSVSLFPR